MLFSEGRSMDKIKIDAQEKGDLGLVAEVNLNIQLIHSPLYTALVQSKTMNGRVKVTCYSCAYTNIKKDNSILTFYKHIYL